MSKIIIPPLKDLKLVKYNEKEWIALDEFVQLLAKSRDESADIQVRKDKIKSEIIRHGRDNIAILYNKNFITFESMIAYIVNHAKNITICKEIFNNIVTSVLTGNEQIEDRENKPEGHLLHYYRENEREGNPTHYDRESEREGSHQHDRENKREETPNHNRERETKGSFHRDSETEESSHHNRENETEESPHHDGESEVEGCPHYSIVYCVPPKRRNKPVTTPLDLTTK